MGSKVEAPKPTNEERLLQKEQAALLRQQRDILLAQGKLQQALLPIFAAQSGIELKFNAKGEIISTKSLIDPKAAIRLQQAGFELQQDIFEMQRNMLPQQQALLAEQLGISREQLAAQRELFPLQRQLLQGQLQQMLQQQAEFGESGDLRRIQRDVEMGLAKRSLAALRGELPVDPALERELETQERTLRDTLQQQLGPGFETSTPGIEALQRFREGAASLRSGAQTGQLTLAEQLGLARTQVRTGQQQAQFQNLGSLGLGQGGIPGISGVNLQQLAGLPGAGIATQQGALFGPSFQLAGGLGQVAGGFGAAQIPFQQQRAMEFQADIFNAQNSGIGALGGLFGGILGALPFPSSIGGKRVWEQLGRTPGGTPIYAYSYIAEPETVYIGVLAEDVPDATMERDGYIVVDYERVN